jgi:predicted hydrocarbon binding protein
VTRVGPHLHLIVERSVTIGTAPGETGCVYYEAAFKELLRLLVSNAGTVEHVRCVVRGEQVCEWRAEWRSGPRSR